ncbi:MAG: spore coat protein CotH [Clostridiales bacterium]|nr:spore coat protein CotH [Clostridiales bacterium]
MFRKCFAIVMLLALLCTLVPVSLGAAEESYEDATLTFSLPSGFYPEPQELEITCSVEDSLIYYTTDGSMPTEDSQILDYTLELGDTTDLPNVLSAIGGVCPDELYIPEQNVMKAHVIRAMAWLPDDTYTPVYSATYWIGADREELYGTMPVVSLMMEYDDLMGYENGIYILGKAYDDYMAEDGRKLDAWDYPANYQIRGREGERPVAVEFLPFEGEGFSMDMGIRIKGGASRSYNSKSLRLIAREEYGQKAITYPVFEDNLRDDGTGIVEKYKSITLRAGGNDVRFAVIRDPLIQKLAEGMRFTSQASRPCALFINGEFWGIKTITEEYSDNYIQYNHGVDNKNVIIMKNGELEEGEEEDVLLWEEMYDFITQNDMSDPANYAAACEMLAMEELMDLAAMHLYIYNKDGIFENNNWQMWRAREVDETNPVADGKWRFLSYDTDFSSGVYDGGKTHTTDNISPVLLDEVEHEHRHTALLVRALWQNEDFRRGMLTSLCDARNIHFDANRFAEVFATFRADYEPYMPETFRRFGPNWVAGWANEYYTQKLDEINVFFGGRYKSFIWLMKKVFALSEPYDVTVLANDTAKGSVTLNGTPLDAFLTRTQGFVGMYFPETPVTLTATPAEGATFTGWLAEGCTLEDPTAATIQVTVSEAVTLTAQFE